MDTNDKVYKPEEIVENPFPGEDTPLQTAQPAPAGTYSPTTTKIQPFPKKQTAQELLSTSLNTKTKKILQEFDLQQSGGFQIGDFKQGVTGDLRITPNGLTARDLAGITTFAIDGTTGDATFRGTLQAAGFTIADESGLVSLNAFESNSKSFAPGGSQAFTTGTPADVSGATITTSFFTRSKRVLMLFDVTVYFNPTTPGAYSGEFEIRISIDGDEPGAVFVSSNDAMGLANSRFTHGLSLIRTLATGEHTIKLRALVNNTTNISCFINGGNLTYLSLGD